MKPYDLTAPCAWDDGLLHIKLPEPPTAIHVHHPNGSVFFGVPTKVEQELRDKNAKLRELVAHLMYVKPSDVNAILYKGKLLRFDDLLAEVGMRWESEVE